METQLRSALIGWLAADPLLAAALNAITEEAPSRTSAPWLALAASASADWSTKDRQGREVRVALELHLRGEEADESATIAGLIEDRIAALPPHQGAFRIVSASFLRARTQQSGQHMRSVLIEYRFRLLEY